MDTVEQQDILLQLNYGELANIVKTDLPLNHEEYSQYTIDEIGNRLLPESIDGKGMHYVAWPQYWKQLKNEFRVLLCTPEKKYQKLRKELSVAANKSHATIVSSIAAVMASQFGVIPGVLVPFCALLLIAILKLGKEAFCSTTNLNMRINDDT